MAGRSPAARRSLLLASLMLLLCSAWFIGRAALPAGPRAGVSGPAPTERAAPEPPRLVVLSPAIAVMLRDIGLVDRIVGRHAYDLVLPAEIPVCGDQLGIDYEALLRVRPTHILVERGATELPDRLISLAADEGWKTRVFPLLELGDIQKCVDSLHTEFVIVPRDLAEGHDPPWLAGDGVMRRRAEAEDRLAESLRFRGRQLQNAGRVLLLGAVTPPAVLGPGSWHHQILERLGGTPAVTSGQPFITLDAEDVLRLAPDAIILVLPRASGAPAQSPSVAELRTLLGRVGELDIPAIRNGRLALLDDPLAHTPSTAMAGLADQMAALLEQWSR